MSTTPQLLSILLSDKNGFANKAKYYWNLGPGVRAANHLIPVTGLSQTLSKFIQIISNLEFLCLNSPHLIGTIRSTVSRNLKLPRSWGEHGIFLVFVYFLSQAAHSLQEIS